MVDQVLCKGKVTKKFYQTLNTKPCSKQTGFFVWKCGRVVYGSGLENQRIERYREFESHRFRQFVSRWCSGSTIVSKTFSCGSIP